MIGNPTITAANPFLGVKSFGVKDSEHFHGRTEQVGEVLRKLRGSHFLAVVGTAGSGKSSMVKGGLVPQLTDSSKNKTRTKWRTTIFHPGKNPISSLASALAQRNVLHPNYKLEPNFETNMENTLRRSSQGLVEAFKNAKLEGDHLLIVVEHFEEIFQLKGNEVKDFVQLLLTAGKHVVPIYIVVTLRSDFIGSCSKFRGLSEMVGQSQFTMPRMKSKELRRVIVEPIMANEASISPRLISRLIQDFDNTPDPLPLASLQHALMRTWSKWEEDVENAKQNNESTNIKIGTSHYEAIGTMENALEIHMDSIYDSLDDTDKALSVKVFKALTESKGSDALGIRRAMTVSELAELTEVSEDKISKIINVYRTDEQHFLVAPDERLHSDSEINLAHDVLMEAWDNLKEWMNEEAESAGFYKRISEAAILYKEGKAGVWGNPDLDFALKWKEDNHPNKAWSLRYNDEFENVLEFLEASKAAYEEEERKKAAAIAEKKRRSRLFAIAMGIFGTVCLILAGAAGWAFYEAQKSAVVAQQKAEEAKINTVKALLSEIEAGKSAKVAEREKESAKIAMTKAEKSAAAATIAQGKAVQSAKKATIAQAAAEKEKIKAVESAEVAEREKLAANEAKKKADKASIAAAKSADEALTAKQAAEKLKSLVLANALSLKSLQLISKEPKALLAKEAYNITVEKGGELHNPDLYAGLYRGAKALQPTPDFNTHKKHFGSVNGLIINGTSIYTAGGDGKILEWSIDGWKKINKPNLKIEPVALAKTGKIQNNMDINPGKSYAVASGEQGNYIIPLKGSEEPNNINIHSSREVWEARFINNNEFISSGADRTIKRYNINAKTETIIDSVSSHVHALATLSKKDLLVGGDRRGNIIVWELGSNKQVSIKNSNLGRVTSLQFSPNGSMLISGHQGGGVQQWFIRGNKISKGAYIGKHTSGVSDLAFSTDGKSLASSSYNGTVKVWIVSTLTNKNPKYIKLYDVNSPATSVSFAKNNEQIVVGYKNGSIQFWTISSEILADDICRKLKRNMTVNEWAKYIGEDTPYRKTCNGLPKGK